MGLPVRALACEVVQDMSCQIKASWFWAGWKAEFSAFWVGWCVTVTMSEEVLSVVFQVRLV